MAAVITAAAGWPVRCASLAWLDFVRRCWTQDPLRMTTARVCVCVPLCCEKGLWGLLPGASSQAGAAEGCGVHRLAVGVICLVGWCAGDSGPLLLRQHAAFGPGWPRPSWCDGAATAA
jgi:hypothetical protein